MHETLRALTWQQASEIRAKYATGLYTQTALGDQYGVLPQTVSLIVRGQLYVQPLSVRSPEFRPERAIPPIPSTMSGNMPAQLPDEDVHAYIIRHNEPVAALYARLDALSDALDPTGADRYAAAVATARARWHALGLEGDALDAAREAA